MRYDDNAFRILGTPANASYAMIMDNFQTMKIRAKAGKAVQENDYLSSICSIKLNEMIIRDAFNKLLNPKIRLQERLFWFSNNTQDDKNAFAKLLSKDLSGATQIWEKSQNIVSIANLSKLYHAQCLIKDPNLLDRSLWQNALMKWLQVLKDGDFWENFIDMEMNSGFEPLATSDEIDEIINKALELVLIPSLNFIHEAIDKKNDDIALNHLELIRNSTIPVSIISNIEEDSLGALETEIHELANSLTEKLSELVQTEDCSLEIKKRGCDRAYQYYKNDLLKSLQRLELLAGKESYTNKRTREITASCLRTISFCYIKDAKSPDLSEQVLKEAQSLAQGTLILDEINEDLSVIQKIIHQEKIWKDSKPIKKAPFLYTIKGIGTKLYGWKDLDPVTGTYISTLYFVFFGIPIFPISRYRVRIIGQDQIAFYKKIPLATFDKCHIAISILLIILGIILISNNNESNYSNRRSSSYKYSQPPKQTGTNYPIRNSGSHSYSQPQKTVDTRTEILKSQIENAKIELNNQEYELKKLEDKIKSYEIQIEFYAAKIKRIEKDIINGIEIDRNDYKSALANHNHYVDLYNAELSKHKTKYNVYEQLFEDTNNKIYEYNKIIGAR